APGAPYPAPCRGRARRGRHFFHHTEAKSGHCKHDRLRQGFNLRFRMNGQWIGEYVGTNQGTLVLDLDEVGDHYEGSAVALESNPSLPPTFALLNVPKRQKSFQLRTPLMPIERVSGRAVSWDELKKNYPPDVTAPDYADTKWEVGTNTIEIFWVTN